MKKIVLNYFEKERRLKPELAIIFSFWIKLFSEKVSREPARVMREQNCAVWEME